MKSCTAAFPTLQSCICVMIGYMAPEFLNGGTITPKSDILSLDVIILEVVTGHRDYPDVTTTPSEEFIELVRKFFLKFPDGTLCILPFPH